MTRKEGVYSFTVYCDQAYLEKVKKAAKDSDQKKISAFVLSILDQHFGDSTVTDTVSNTVLTDILARLALIENTVFNKVTDTVISTVADTVTDTVISTVADTVTDTVISTVADTVTDTVTSEATAPANFTPALLQKAKAIAPLKLMQAA